MLRRLRIENLVLIREAELELAPGLNAITGEIAIIDVASGTIIRHWPHTLSEDYSTDLSISADGRLIAFTNYIGSGNSAIQVSRVMSTSAPSGPDRSRPTRRAASPSFPSC